ncbi:hypothetical protein K1719_016985 [Acacia pycnantha]|nr:hypothetical protein K1719_016985 [Acacia pycnantha]
MKPLEFERAMRLIVRITTCLQQSLRNFKAPFLVLHGTANTVTDLAASMKFYEEASSSNKSIRLYEELLHDLLLEPGRHVIT